MAGGSAPTPDTAITLSISRLAGLLGVKPALLKDILGTTAVELRDQPKIVAGGIDSARDMGFWPFFNSIGSIHTLDVPRAHSIQFLRRRCTNGAVNAGNHTILIEPAANSVVTVYLLSQVNRDIVGRDVSAELYTAGASVVARLYYTAALAAGASQPYPNKVATAPYLNVERLTLTDRLEILISAFAIDVSQDSDFYISYIYIGDAPTITETGPAGSAFADVA